MAREQVSGGGLNLPPFAFLPENLGRKIQIQRSGHLNLYLLLDASQSVLLATAVQENEGVSSEGWGRA